MQRLAGLWVVVLVMVGLMHAPSTQAGSASQLFTPSPTPLFGPPPPPTPTPLGGVVPPSPTPFRAITVTIAPRPNLAATATAAAATITAADATLTAVAARSLEVALTATALAVPTATPTATASPTRTATPVVTPTPTSTATATPSPTTTRTPTPSPSPTPDPLALNRTVLTRAAIVVGEETLAPGTALVIPLDVLLEDGAIPPATPVRLPDGRVVTLPPGVSIPAAESPTVVSAPLNAVLPQPGRVGERVYPAGTRLVLPSGTSVLGALAPNATVLLEPGTIVQLDAQSVTLLEPLQVVVSAEPVPLPAVLPPTGEADPVLWPALIGLLLLAGGWWLLRHGSAGRPRAS